MNDLDFKYEDKDHINFVSKDVLKIHNKTFNDINDYKKYFNKYSNIIFINCEFDLCNIDTSICTENYKLKFDKCTLKGEFRHILCKEIIFEDCEISNYVFNNYAEEKIVIEKLLFFNCNIDRLDFEGVVLKGHLIKNNKNRQFKIMDTLKLKNCILEKDLLIDREGFIIKKLDLSHSLFKDKAELKFISCIIENASFYNTKFKDLVSFYESTFYYTDFKRANFENIVIFSKCKFNEDIDFKYVKFLGKAIFKDAIFKKILNLRNTIFGEDSDFLDVSSSEKQKKDIKVANRETARIIKNLFDKSGNIIEANKFYKLEMDKRLEDINKSKISDKIIFYFHKYSSNHSQSWVLTLFWMIILTFIVMSFKNNIYIIKIVSIAIFILGFCCTFLCFRSSKEQLLDYCIFLLVCLIVFVNSILMEDYMLQKFTETFYLFIKNDEINLLTLFYKLLMAYLSYQFVVSIRQNTRRK